MLNMLNMLDDVEFDDIDETYYVIEIDNLSSLTDAKNILAKIKFIEKKSAIHKIVLLCNADRIKFDSNKVEILKGLIQYLSKKQSIVSLAIDGIFTKCMEGLVIGSDAVSLSKDNVENNVVDLELLAAHRSIQLIDSQGSDYVNEISGYQKVELIVKNRFLVSTKSLHKEMKFVA